MKILNASERGFSTVGMLAGVVVLIVLVVLFLSGDIKSDQSASTSSNTNLLPTEEIASGATDVTPISRDTVDPQASAPVVAVTNETPTTSPAASSEPLAVGVYTEYDESLLANATDGTVLIFFHATWCPSCRALEKDIEANLERIPNDLTMLKVDYDTEIDMRKKYGIVRQHTLIEVDANGNLVKTLTGLSNTLDQVVKQI